MSVWDSYASRLEVRGNSKYEATARREARYINRHLPDNLSYHTIRMYDSEHGFNINEDTDFFTQSVSIDDTDNLNEKLIISMPNESLEAGTLLDWKGNFWLITEVDANDTLYTRGKLLQCNHLLHWIEDGNIMEQWSIVTDGTKYLTGEMEDRNFVVTRGDSRIGMQLARNEHTVKLARDDRFLIDDADSPHKLAYLLTKPLKIGAVYGKRGTYSFVLQEVTATEFDNHKLGIADYYKWFNEDGSPIKKVDDVKAPTSGKKVWL